jgi:flagellar hook assembly protein FlgD
MQGETYFTFDLFAPEAPQSCVIKIFTVAGRHIKDVKAAARVGFNQIYWDGKDNDGETIANGIYLYKLILEGNGKTETSIQKLAILK